MNAFFSFAPDLFLITGTFWLICYACLEIHKDAEDTVLVVCLYSGVLS